VRIGVPHWASWTADDGPPAAELLPRRLRRRTSGLTRACAEVLGRLAQGSTVDLGTAPVIYASAWGEMQTTIGLLAMMHEDDGAVSPTRFHNSVHNTAAGYLSIATANTGFATALAGGPATCAAAILEAVGWLGTEGSDVLVVVAEQRVTEPFVVDPDYVDLAVALQLSAEPSTGPQIDGLRRAELPEMQGVSERLRGNPCAPALALVAALEDAVAHSGSGAGGRTVALELPRSSPGQRPKFGWVVDVGSP
jgi:hypothetical protein